MPARSSLFTARTRLVAVLLLVSVCSCEHTPVGTDPRAHATLFRQGQELFLAGNYASAAVAFDRFIATGPSPPKASEATYYKGLAHLALKQFPQAKACFQTVGEESPRAHLRAYAHKALGDTYFAQEDYAKAEMLYRNIVKKNSPDTPNDEVLYKLGVALQRQNEWEYAKLYFRDLYTNYPSSRWRERALKRYEAEERLFSVQLGAFSTRQAADQLSRNLAAHGFPPYTREVKQGAGTLFVVRVGKYKTYPDASSLAKRLQSAGFATLVMP